MDIRSSELLISLPLPRWPLNREIPTRSLGDLYIDDQLRPNIRPSRRLAQADVLWAEAPAQVSPGWPASPRHLYAEGCFADAPNLLLSNAIRFAVIQYQKIRACDDLRAAETNRRRRLSRSLYGAISLIFPPQGISLIFPPPSRRTGGPWLGGELKSRTLIRNSRSCRLMPSPPWSLCRALMAAGTASPPARKFWDRGRRLFTTIPFPAYRFHFACAYLASLESDISMTMVSSHAMNLWGQRWPLFPSSSAYWGCTPPPEKCSIGAADTFLGPQGLRRPIKSEYFLPRSLTFLRQCREMERPIRIGHIGTPNW